MSDYKWQPIEALSDKDKAIDLAATRSLYDTWQASKIRLKQSSEESLKRFTERLVRRLSIETGILERIYDLDRGTTEALVAKGFAEDLVSRSSTDIEPSRLTDILRDQEAAILLVMDCVARNRELTKGLLHELHSILTRHQETTSAVDQFGTRHEIRLLRGRFKEHPNNPKRPDGSMHEYCPPLQVDSEIERLLSLLSTYSREDPILVGAWFHHRFTQIHPYQDGNGRLARALLTLVLLRADLLPLVVDRDLRTEYLDALQSADHGDLAPLATTFARLEKHALLQALSVDVDAEVSHDRTLTSAVIDSLVGKFDRRRRQKESDLRKVNGVALGLRSRARKAIELSLTQLGEPLAQFAKPEIHVADGGPDRGNAYWYKHEVIESGKKSGKYVNFSEEHYFVKGTIRAGRERLVFVVSLHHVGRDLSGIMEATAFANLETYDQPEDREQAPQDFFPCSLEPFVFAHTTTDAEIAASFDRWLDAGMAVAIKEYGDRL